MHRAEHGVPERGVWGAVEGPVVRDFAFGDFAGDVCVDAEGFFVFQRETALDGDDGARGVADGPRRLARPSTFRFSAEAHHDGTRPLEHDGIQIRSNNPFSLIERIDRRDDEVLTRGVRSAERACDRLDG